MTQVEQAIATLLYDHPVVIVPGLGAFMCQPESAKVNVITNQFEKPSATLSFDPHQREENDLVAGYLMAQDDITHDEARQRISEFVLDCFAKLKNGDTVNIPDVGSLSFVERLVVAFTPVDSNDFNGDAFGLEDFQPEMIYASGNQDDWKQQVTQQIKDLNTPMTVDISHDDDKRGRGWIWLLLLLLIAGGVALWYFKFRPLLPPEKPEDIDTVKVTDTTVVPLDTVNQPLDTLGVLPDSLRQESDSVEQQPIDTVVEPVAPVEPEKPSGNSSQSVEPVEIVKPSPEIKAFIVGGCFSVEQNALNMVNATREQGCTEAFVMKRGSMYYVCYGGYATTADAKRNLPEVLEKYNKKAWILTK